MPIMQLSALQLQEKIRQNQQLLLLDVREQHEYSYAHIQGSQLMPLGLIPTKAKALERDQDIVLICHHGVRSMQAAVFLNHSGFKRLYNLTGGIDAWSVECDSSVPRY